MLWYLVRRLLEAIPVFLGATLLLYALVFLRPGDPVAGLGGERGLPEAVQPRSAGSTTWTSRSSCSTCLPQGHLHRSTSASRSRRHRHRRPRGGPPVDVPARDHGAWSSRPSSASSSASSPGCARAASSTRTVLRVQPAARSRCRPSSSASCCSSSWASSSAGSPVDRRPRLGLLSASCCRRSCCAADVVRPRCLAPDPHARSSRTSTRRLRPHRARQGPPVARGRRRATCCATPCIPVVTFLGADLGNLMGGAIVTEGIFNINGVGGTLYAGDHRASRTSRSSSAHHRAVAIDLLPVEPAR